MSNRLAACILIERKFIVVFTLPFLFCFFNVSNAEKERIEIYSTFLDHGIFLKFYHVQSFFFYSLRQGEKVRFFIVNNCLHWKTVG